MSVKDILSPGGKILTEYIDDSAVFIPISNVNGLQADLNTLQSEIVDLGVMQLFSEFYALMPSDNASAVAVGSAVLFPQTGPTNSNIVRTSTSQFNLPNAGVYEVYFNATVAEAGQLGVALNGTLVAKSVVGRDALTSQIVGHCLVTTVAANTVLTVVNPSGNAAPLTLTASAGGTHAVSATLLIKRVA